MSYSMVPGYPPPPHPWQQPVPHPAFSELHRMQQEQQDSKEYREIYEYVKKQTKKKYQSKIDKLKQQVKLANQSADLARKRPEQRTVKLQTKNPTAYISRGVNATQTFHDDKEISAQPTFRQDSLEKAISEKLDEIEKKAKEYKRISYRPPSKFVQLGKPVVHPLHALETKYKRIPGYRARPINNDGTNTPHVQRQLFRPSTAKRRAPYEKEKRIDSYSQHEIHSAMKTLLH